MCPMLGFAALTANLRDVVGLVGWAERSDAQRKG